MTMMEIGQRHSGALFVTPDGDGLRADIEINDDRIVVSINGGESFQYGRDQVRAQAFDSRTVLLDITDDEDLYFSADDPFRFMELALPALQGGQSPTNRSTTNEPSGSQPERKPTKRNAWTDVASEPKSRQPGSRRSVAANGSDAASRRRARVAARERNAGASVAPSAAPNTTGTGDESEKRWRLPVIGTTLPAPAEPRRSSAASSKKRRRSADRATCRHQWRSLNLSGGLVRRVCEDCGHVSIDITG